jgi:hypothetical protein
MEGFLAGGESFESLGKRQRILLHPRNGEGGREPLESLEKKARGILQLGKRQRASCSHWGREPLASLGNKAKGEGQASNLLKT